jgi:hypothetical protein
MSKSKRKNHEGPLVEMLRRTQIDGRSNSLSDESGLPVWLAGITPKELSDGDRSALAEFLRHLVADRIWSRLEHPGQFYQIAITTTDHLTGRKTSTVWSVDRNETGLEISRGR